MLIRKTAPVLNVVLRLTTLGTRFILIFVLAKFLDAASVGYYGLFTAAIGYALLCVGMDFYVYTNREVLKAEETKRGRLIKGQIAWVGILYLIFAPLVLFVLPAVGLPEFLVWWFLPILVLEHINQELYRLLIILSRQLSASLLLFVRQGSWALAVALLMALSENDRNLHIVMLLWACAGATAAVAGIWKLHRMKFGGWRERIDWIWVKRGITVSGAFLVSSLALRGIQTFDRYWLEDLVGIEIVGAYVLFFGMASALNVFLDAALYSFKYPELVRLSQTKDYLTMRRVVRILSIKAIVICMAFSAATYFLLPVLLAWIDEPVYESQISLYYWVLAGTVAYSLSMIPHYALYALSCDRTIIMSHIVALPVFALVTLFAADRSELYAVPIGVLVSMMVVLAWKIVACAKFLPNPERRPQSR